MHLTGVTPTDYFAAAPVDDPLSYPGLIPPYSYLLLGPGQLRRLRAPSVPEGRHAVAAIGSNAAPAQLVRKFATAGVSCVVPVLQATIGRLRILPSAHVNAAGYIPWAPADSGDDAVSAPAFVTFLDDSQLVRMDETEPNYTRLALSPAAHPVHLAGATEPLNRCDIYISNHGVITDERVIDEGAPASQLELRERLRKTNPDMTFERLGAAGLSRALRDHLRIEKRAF